MPEGAPQTVATRHRDAAWPGIVALILCAALWSLNGPLIKLLSGPAGEPGLAGITIAFYRSLFGGLFFLPLAARQFASLRRASAAWPIAALITFTVMTASFVIATTMTAASSAIILQYSAPIWVFLLAPLLLRERPERLDALVLALAMAGVTVIFFRHPTADRAALLVGLLSGVGYAGVILTLRALREVNGSVVLALNFLGSAILLAPAVAWFDSFALTGRQLLLAAALGVIQMALPYLIFSWALRRVEAHRASLIVLLETVLNPLFTYLAVGERVPTPTLLGGPLILLSVVLWTLLAWRRDVRVRRNLRRSSTIGT